MVTKKGTKKAKTTKKAQQKSKEDKPKKISPFDIIDMMFTKKDEFDKLSKFTLEKNFFMINRVFSIKYPTQAQFFNNLKINTAEVIKCWQQFLTKYEIPNKVPYFVYTKGSKKSSDAKDEVKFKKQDIVDYAKKYNLSLRDVEDIIQFKPQEFTEQIQELDKLRSLQNQSEKFQNKNDSVNNAD